MSLNWKEIDVIVSELDLPGAQIQKIIQSNFNTLCLSVFGRGGAEQILIVTAPGACRLHTTKRAVPKSDKPLRFAELLKSKIINARIEEVSQLGKDRIVRFVLRQHTENGAVRFRLYVRLWSNAANVILTGDDGTILDAMRRLPKRGEVSGGFYRPEAEAEGVPTAAPKKEYAVREFPDAPEDGLSFNEKIDRWYAEHGASLSLEALRAEAQKVFEGALTRLEASLEHLREKEAEYAGADKLKEYGDLILANVGAERADGAWLDCVNFYDDERPVRIKLDAKKNLAKNAEHYFELYRKAKSGLLGVREEIADGEAELFRQKTLLAALLSETNPLRLQKQLRQKTAPKGRADGRKRPGLSFRRGEWLLLVGRDAAENDELLRHYVKGKDLWLHARDFPGAYVFIKARAGKTVPLNILLDAANLALFYSKGRKAGRGDLFYTPVKYLRRAKNGPKGLVIPTHEKNLAAELDGKRLKELEGCRE